MLPNNTGSLPEAAWKALQRLKMSFFLMGHSLMHIYAWSHLWLTIQRTSELKAILEILKVNPLGSRMRMLTVFHILFGEMCMHRYLFLCFQKHGKIKENVMLGQPHFLLWQNISCCFVAKCDYWQYINLNISSFYIIACPWYSFLG